MYSKPMQLNYMLKDNIAVSPDAILNPDAFGVEVELEGFGVNSKCPAVVRTYWTKHEDGSLRKLVPDAETVEYVTVCPLALPELTTAIGLLFKFLHDPKVEVFDSYRTSIHVHLNFACEPYRVIFNFMTLSLILDELLVSQNGDHRIGNNFCLRAKDAMGQVVSLTNSIQNKGNFFNLVNNERYSSINFASLMKFGSIEFRSLECTTHEGRLLHWINTLQRIKEASRKFTNPLDIIQKFSSLNPETFLDEILGPYALKYQKVPNMDRMLFRGMRIAQDIAYSATWEESGRTLDTTLRQKFGALPVLEE